MDEHRSHLPKNTIWDIPRPLRCQAKAKGVLDDVDAAVAGLRARGIELLVGEVERYEDIYKLCYLRGPEGIIVELAEKLD